MKEKLCPCADALAKAVEVRKEPNKYKNDKKTFDYAETLGEDIQRYADELECELGGHHVKASPFSSSGKQKHLYLEANKMSNYIIK